MIKKYIVIFIAATMVVFFAIDIVGTIQLSSKRIALDKYGTHIGSGNMYYKRDSLNFLYDISTGEVKIDSIDWIYVEDFDTLAILAKYNKRAYFNINTGELLTDITGDKAWAFLGDRGVMSKGDSITIYRRDGSVVPSSHIHYRNEVEMTFRGGALIVAGDDSLYGLIDTAAQWILPPENVYIVTDTVRKIHIAKKDSIFNIYDFNITPIQNRIDTVALVKFIRENYAE